MSVRMHSGGSSSSKEGLVLRMLLQDSVLTSHDMMFLDIRVAPIIRPLPSFCHFHSIKMSSCFSSQEKRFLSSHIFSWKRQVVLWMMHFRKRGLFFFFENKEREASCAYGYSNNGPWAEQHFCVFGLPAALDGWVVAVNKRCFGVKKKTAEAELSSVLQLGLELFPVSTWNSSWPDRSTKPRRHVPKQTALHMRAGEHFPFHNVRFFRISYDTICSIFPI